LDEPSGSPPKSGAAGAAGGDGGDGGNGGGWGEEGGGDGGDGARLGGSTDESGARPRLQQPSATPSAVGQQSPDSPMVAQPVYAEQEVGFDGAALLAGPTGESGARPRAQQPSAMP
jgi:hypothetical protein